MAHSGEHIVVFRRAHLVNVCARKLPHGGNLFDRCGVASGLSANYHFAVFV